MAGSGRRDHRPLPGAPRPGGLLGRRDFFRMAGVAVAGGALVGPLSGCARKSSTSTGGSGAVGSGGGPSTLGGLRIASPDNPVTWAIAPGNQPIAAGLTPEKGATLKIYNYADYLNPEVFKSFEAQYGAKVEVSTFNDIPEALAKIRSGTVDFDIFLPSYDVIGKLVTTGLIRPINHEYIPNITNVWPEFQNPFYDGEWRYSIPYTTYTTGLAWRTDRVSEDISARANPWDVFWDQKYTGKIAVLDDYRETISMVMLRNGAAEHLNDADPATLAKVQSDLLAMVATTKPRVTITGYTDLPEGKFSITHCWSGDSVAMTGYLPEGADPGILRYWFPQDGKGLVNSDLMVMLKAGKNPVLSHLFLNHILDPKVALENFSFVGYQPPQNTITAESLVSEEVIPQNLSTATVLPSYYASGYRTLELSPEDDAAWSAVWQRFKAGA
jgi:spermidine/putrescine transport system substrate-binding protein